MTRAPLKILIHTPVFWPCVGGIEKATENIASGLTSLGHFVTVATETQTTKPEREFVFSVVRRPSFFESIRLVSSADIVFSNGSTANFFPFAKLLGKPFVWTHQTYRFIPPKLSGPGDLVGGCKVIVRRAIAHAVDRNVAISRHMDIEQSLPGQTVIYNPVDVVSFMDIPLCSGEFTFGFLGRIVDDKGLDLLLRALATVNSNRPHSPATLNVIGDGADKEKLQLLANQLAIGRQVTWSGACSGESLRRAIASAGIFVLPSRWAEPMGLVAPELMAAGKPLILPDRGGLSECAGDACLTFSIGDFKTLADAMNQLLHSPALQQTLQQRGLERCQLFSVDNIARQYETLFRDILQQT